MGVSVAEFQHMLADDSFARASLFAPASPSSARGVEPAPAAPPAAPSTPRTHRGGKQRMTTLSYHARMEREAEANCQRRIDDGTYRTEMCPSGSKCPRLHGRSCTFAHDKSELRARHPLCAHQHVFHLAPCVLMLRALTLVCVRQLQDEAVSQLARLWSLRLWIPLPLLAWLT